MEAFFESRSRSNWSYDTLKNFRQISPVVQSHLKRVYLTLCCALVASAFGAYLHILWNIGGYLTSFACFGTMIWLLSIPLYQEVSFVLDLSLINDGSLCMFRTQLLIWYRKFAAKESFSSYGIRSVRRGFSWSSD
ncbi:bax inhibitor 1-like [Gossypium australe]|uniref:Bax inhibitor 1-like n=1 Tax=Gossypium australe TaxID=47621 RepID=A0A5B6VJ81_9ROSI|nr:bax inhibitor 1-like [Gossypium australe]